MRPWQKALLPYLEPPWIDPFDSTGRRSGCCPLCWEIYMLSAHGMMTTGILGLTLAVTVGNDGT